MHVLQQGETSRWFWAHGGHHLSRSSKIQIGQDVSRHQEQKVSKIEFPAPWIDTDGKVKYNHIDLKTHEDLKVMQRTYHCRLTKGSIEFDAIISRYIEDVIKML